MKKRNSPKIPPMPADAVTLSALSPFVMAAREGHSVKVYRNGVEFEPAREKWSIRMATERCRRALLSGEQDVAMIEDYDANMNAARYKEVREFAEFVADVKRKGAEAIDRRSAENEGGRELKAVKPDTLEEAVEPVKGMGVRKLVSAIKSAWENGRKSAYGPSLSRANILGKILFSAALSVSLFGSVKLFVNENTQKLPWDSVQIAVSEYDATNADVHEKALYYLATETPPPHDVVSDVLQSGMPDLLKRKLSNLYLEGRMMSGEEACRVLDSDVAEKAGKFLDAPAPAPKKQKIRDDIGIAGTIASADDGGTAPGAA